METYEALIFRVRITELSDNQYAITITQSPIPEHIHLSRSFEIPESLLQQIEQLDDINDPIAFEEQQITTGQSLFQTIFSKSLREAYHESYEAAAEQNLGLTVQFNLQNAGPLTDLPWELLYDETGFIGLGRYITLERYHNTLIQYAPVDTQAPYRILVILANPPDIAIPAQQSRLDLIRETFEMLRDNQDVRIDFLPVPSLETLREYLRNRTYQAVHYTGHARHQQNHDETIVFVDEATGKPEWIRSETLARELRNAGTIQALMLQLLSVSGNTHTAIANHLAVRLIRRGIPAVIINRLPMKSVPLEVFLQSLYSGLSRGLTPPRAVQNARRGIDLRVDGQDWYAPAIYTPDKAIRKSIVSLPWWFATPVISVCVLMMVLLIFYFTGQNTESADADNRPVNIEVSGVDLSAHLEPFPAYAALGRPTTFTLTIHNRGDQPVEQFNYHIHINGMPGFTPRILSETDLPAGVETRIEIPYVFDSPCACILYVAIDPDNLIDEVNEQNNIATLPLLASE